MVEVRACEQCGTEFTPRREHARFCSTRCRLAWTPGDARQATVSVAALDWAVNAMIEVTSRLDGRNGADASDSPVTGRGAVTDRGAVTGRGPVGGGSAPASAPAPDLRHAAIAVSEATWWVTLVDATLVRYFPGGYDAVLDAQPAPGRAEIEHTLAGLRYVRNQMGVHLDPDEFLRAAAANGNAGEAAPAWTWSPLPEPVTQELSPRGEEWERSRYRAYQDWLAGRAITHTFALAAGFLRMAAASFPPESSLTA
jgi:hypothetical protein